MIEWSTDKPRGAKIVAKLASDFCMSDSAYDVLFLSPNGAYYYDSGGEEIPTSSIEKWALIEE